MVFLEHEVKRLLKEAGISVPKGLFVSKEKAEQLSTIVDLSYPLVAKVSSTKISSKSNVQGVRIGLKNACELKKAVTELLQIKDAEGVLLEEMAPQGLEVIVGGIEDELFGPVVMFGLGGIFVELFKDVAFALAPLTEEEALWLIQQVKGYQLLEGYRGRPSVDKDTLLKIIVTISTFIATGLIKEIDLNPIALYPEGAMVLDAKMLVNAQIGNLRPNNSNTNSP
ncbi:MAG TPA: acetate--CoA ligase family protein [Candidatus Limnocylindrales bacterium]|nr:acetate--CoA ligase family protein [Candidatus Limnocylindrales bacterium]